MHNTLQEGSNITDTIILNVTKTDNINTVCRVPRLEMNLILTTAIQCTGNSGLMVSQPKI